MPRRLLLLLIPLLAACISTSGNDATKRVPGRVEDLGVPVKELRVQLGPLSPDPSGNGFVQLLYSFPGEPRVNPDKPFEVVAVDLQTKAVKRVPASSAHQGVGFEVWAPQGPVWSRGKDPRLFFRPNGGDTRLMSWDPRTQTVWDSGRLFSEWPKASIVYSLASGTDNWIIGGGGGDSPIVRYNPETGEIRQSPPASQPGDYRPAYAQEVAGDVDATYVLTGKQPYRVVARPNAGGDDKVLLQFEDAALFEPGGATKARLDQGVDDVYLYLALKGGAQYSILEGDRLVTQTVPGAAGSRVDLNWKLTGGTQITPLANPPELRPPPTPLPPQPPEVVLDKTSVANKGLARLWYRFERDARPSPDSLPATADPQDYGWKMIDVPVNAVSLKTSQALADPRGGLFGSTYYQGDFYHYDPETKGLDVLGPAVLGEVYSMTSTNGKVYISGYANALVYEYDPGRPWTSNPGNPLAPRNGAVGPDANPKEIANFMNDIGALSGDYMVHDSTGRIYVGTVSSRNRVGGGLGILTPKAGGGWQPSSISTPLDNYETAGLAVSTDGRYVTLSSRAVTDPAKPAATPKEARVFVLDTQGDLSTFGSQWVPVEGAEALGQVTGVSPTRVIGTAPADDGTTKLYLLDVVSGQVLRSIEYSGEISKSGSLLTGADGAAYAAVKTPTGRRIVRISPDLGGPAPVTPVAEVKGDYERLAVVGRDLYLTGTGYKTNDVADLKRVVDFMAVR